MSASYAFRVELRDRWALHAKRAVAYLRTTRDALGEEWDGIRAVTLIPSECWQLLDLSLETAQAIVAEFPDDYFAAENTRDLFGDSFTYNASDAWYEEAKALVELIEKRRGTAKQLRRIEALEATSGRTPEEVAMYQAKAKELRERLASGSG